MCCSYLFIYLLMSERREQDTVSGVASQKLGISICSIFLLVCETSIQY